MLKIKDNKSFSALDNLLIISFFLSSLAYFLLQDSSYFTGFIWSLMIGLMMGSYATCVVSRMPKKILIVRRVPYCESCEAILKPKDLYPILSHFMNSGLCRFCKAKIPITLLVVEILTALNYVLNYFIFGWNLQYLGITSIFLCLITFFAMLFSEKFFSNIMIVITLIVMMLSYLFW